MSNVDEIAAAMNEAIRQLTAASEKANAERRKEDDFYFNYQSVPPGRHPVVKSEFMQGVSGVFVLSVRTLFASPQCVEIMESGKHFEWKKLNINVIR